MTKSLGTLTIVFSVALFLALAAVRPQAHKTVVSKFTYYQDVLPILEARCGRCHVDGGVAPTLLTYDAARSFPWGIQQALLSRRMPPWGADDGLAAIKGHQSLSIVEFDTLMTWAAGGTPEGTARTSSIRPQQGWPLGPPDLIVPMPQAVAVDGDHRALDHEVAVPLPAAGKWIRVVDLQPGARSIVRRAEFSLRAGGRGTVIGVWLPGEIPQPLGGGGAFRVPDGASLVMRLHYEKSSALAAERIEDRSSAGIYFADAAASRPIETLIVGDDAPTPFGSARTVTQPIARATRIVAVRPISGPDDAMTRIVIVDAKGARTPIMRLQLRSEWPRRYVLESPIRVGRGSSIEIAVTASQAPIFQSLTGDRPAEQGEGGPLRIGIETIAP
jgi:hypothetical protein